MEGGQVETWAERAGTGQVRAGAIERRNPEQPAHRWARAQF